MKKFLIILVCALCLTACGDDDSSFASHDEDSSVESSSSSVVSSSFGDLRSSSSKKEKSSSSIDKKSSSSEIASKSSSSRNNSGSSVKSSSSSAKIIKCIDHNFDWSIPKETYLNPEIQYDSIVDERDGKAYKTVEIGNQVWMAENLNYSDSINTPSLLGKSWCYCDDEQKCNVIGRLYTWAAAIDSVALYDDGNGVDCGYGHSCLIPEKVQGICPNGWRLPTKNDWSALFEFVGGWLEAALALKSGAGWLAWVDKGRNGNGTNSFGFSALPAGCRIVRDRIRYEDAGQYTFFWSSTPASTPSVAILQYYDDPGYQRDRNKYDAYSVRCVKD